MDNFESVKTYLIPDDKREEYFDYADRFKEMFRDVSEENWNTYDDPLVTIDMSTFTMNQIISIKLFMVSIGAKDVTQYLT